MRDVTKKLRVAIYDLLRNDAGVTAAGATGVHYHRAPEGESLPYIVFSRVAPGLVERATFGNEIITNDLWQISAFADEDSDTDREPHLILEDILIAAEDALTDNISIAGHTVKYAKKNSDIPSLSENANGRWIFQEGFNLRVRVSVDDA